MKKKLLKTFGFILIIFLISCQTNPCSLSNIVLKDIAKLDSLINVPEVKKRNRDWNKANYNEPSIFDAKNETYRFKLASTFGRGEIYRIEKNYIYK